MGRKYPRQTDQLVYRTGIQMLLPDLHKILDPQKPLIPRYRPVEPINFFEALIDTYSAHVLNRGRHKKVIPYIHCTRTLTCCILCSIYTCQKNNSHLFWADWRKPKPSAKSVSSIWLEDTYDIENEQDLSLQLLCFIYMCRRDNSHLCWPDWSLSLQQNLFQAFD